MNEVYVIAGGEWLRNNLNAIAAFMSTRTWDSIEKIALTLSVLAVAVMWVQRHNVMDLLGWVAVFVLISLLVNVRTSVQIIGKRKPTAVCSHQTRIGNLDAHLTQTD
ncbi:conjugal transfer protein TraG N-terminal domain-containing protein, partial [Escherichia coli]|uniref:conjugal transfer protein TraG N-terminal domain-containing protein n=1 Tax=Escherichia coli TaxID=562 RepID=UPI002023AA7D